MKLTDQLRDYINAGFPGLWLQTAEPDEAEQEIVQLAQRQKWKVAVWDIANGLRLPGSLQQDTSSAGDPLAALRALPALGGDKKSSGLLLLHNFHKFLNSPEVIQTTISQLVTGKRL